MFGSWHSCLSFGFMSGFGHSRSVFCHCVSAQSQVRSAARSPGHVCFVVLHAVRVSVGCVHSCYILRCVCSSVWVHCHMSDVLCLVFCPVLSCPVLSPASVSPRLIPSSTTLTLGCIPCIPRCYATEGTVKLFLCKVCYTQVSGTVQTTCSNTLSSIRTRHFSHTTVCT